MKAWSVIGLLFAATIFAMVPISPQVTPRGVELSVDQAQAITYRRARVTAAAGGKTCVSGRSLRSRRRRCWLWRGRVLRRLWLSGLFRTIRTVLRNWLWLWVVLRRLQLSSLQLCWLRLSGLRLWRLLPAGLSHCPPGGDPSGPLALRAWGILIAVRMGAPDCKPELGAF